MCIRVWDNIFTYGTYFIFNVVIAILKLGEKKLLSYDLDGITNYFKSFKELESKASHNISSYETIIKESLKVKISYEKLEKLRFQYKDFQ